MIANHPGGSLAALEPSPVTRGEDDNLYGTRSASGAAPLHGAFRWRLWKDWVD
jgi:hypothetical protein